MGRFVALPYNLLESDAWKEVSPEAALLYIELKRRYNGKNNGDIPLSCREGKEIAHCSKGTASKKLIELVEHGFIKQAYKGQWRYRKASTWILTCEVHEGKAPSNEWKNYSKFKTPVPVAELYSTCSRTGDSEN